MSSKFVVPILLSFCLAAPAMAQPATSKPAMLIYGNYCGPGNRAPLPPIDALDAACARHDACFPDDALPDRSCNLRLQHEAAMVANDPRQPQDLRFMAGLVSMGASMMLAKADAVPSVPIAAASSRPRLATRPSRWARLSVAKPRHGWR